MLPRQDLHLANAPIVTMIGMAIVSPWIDELEPDGLNAVAVLDALMIVAGSTFAGASLTPSENRA